MQQNAFCSLKYQRIKHLFANIDLNTISSIWNSSPRSAQNAWQKVSMVTCRQLFMTFSTPTSASTCGDLDSQYKQCTKLFYRKSISHGYKSAVIMQQHTGRQILCALTQQQRQQLWKSCAINLFSVLQFDFCKTKSKQPTPPFPTLVNKLRFLQGYGTFSERGVVALHIFPVI